MIKEKYTRIPTETEKILISNDAYCLAETLETLIIEINSLKKEMIRRR